MRLSTAEVWALTEVMGGYLSSITASLYLHGSRVDDSKKGGDIDLLLVVDDTVHRRAIVSQRHLIVESFKQELGDRRIDLTIATTDQITNDPFLRSVSASTVLLKTYG